MALIKRRSGRENAPQSIVDQILKDYANITSADFIADKITSLNDELDCIRIEITDLRRAISGATHKLTLANGRVRKENYLYAKNICESAKAYFQDLKKSEDAIAKALTELFYLSNKIENMKKIEESVKVIESFNKLSQGGSKILAPTPMTELETAVKRASYSMDAYLELKSN